MVHNKIRAGLRDGIPIALGYFSVSFSFGMLAVQDGISPFHAVLISLMNLTSGRTVCRPDSYSFRSVFSGDGPYPAGNQYQICSDVSFSFSEIGQFSKDIPTDADRLWKYR